MPPELTPDNVMNSTAFNSKHFGESFLADTALVEKSSNLYDFVFSKFGFRGFASSGIFTGRVWPKPVAFFGVSGIIGIRSDSKMVRVAARRIVAMMTYKKSCVVRSVMARIRKTMRFYDGSVRQMKSAVALSLASAAPRPALFSVFSDVYFAPESVSIQKDNAYWFEI